MRSLAFDQSNSRFYSFAIDDSSTGTMGEDILIEFQFDVQITAQHPPSSLAGGGDFEALAIRSSDGAMFGILDRGAGTDDELYRVTQGSGLVNLIGTLTGFTQIRSLPGTTPGALSAVDLGTDQTISINHLTAATTVIGPAGAAVQGMTWLVK